MSAMTLPLPVGHLLRRDWLASVALHGALLGGALWLVAGPTPQVQRLDVTLGWAAPEPVPPRVEPTPVLPPPLPAPRVRPVEPQRPRVPAPRPEPQAPAQAFDSAPLQSAPAVALPEASLAPVAPVVSAAPPVPAAPENVAPVRPASLAPAVVDDQAYQQWRARLEQALRQSKRYPTGARRMGQTGTVVVHLRIAADGSLQHCMLHDSSGFKVLDQAAEQLVRSVAQSLGAQTPPGRSADLRIPIVYELTES